MPRVASCLLFGPPFAQTEPVVSLNTVFRVTFLCLFPSLLGCGFLPGLWCSFPGGILVKKLIAFENEHYYWGAPKSSWKQSLLAGVILKNTSLFLNKGLFSLSRIRVLWMARSPKSEKNVILISSSVLGRLFPCTRPCTTHSLTDLLAALKDNFWKGLCTHLKYNSWESSSFRLDFLPENNEHDA